MFTFYCSWCWSPLFLTSSFFLFCWNGGENWCSPVLGVWNSDTFLSLPRQHCFIQDLWFIPFCFSWMWPCCESHTPCISISPPWFLKNSKKATDLSRIAKTRLNYINCFLSIKKARNFLVLFIVWQCLYLLFNNTCIYRCSLQF